jgi:hypothetical protein
VAKWDCRGQLCALPASVRGFGWGERLGVAGNRPLGGDVAVAAHRSRPPALADRVVPDRVATDSRRLADASVYAIALAPEGEHDPEERKSADREQDAADHCWGP